MQLHVVAEAKWLETILTRHLALLAPAQDGRVMGRGCGECVAFLDEKVVECADGERFGVPVVEHGAGGLGDFGVWEAFHACSAGDVRGVGKGPCEGAYARDRQDGSWSSSFLMFC